MEALREIVKTDKKYHNIKLPDWAVGREVEVIVLPLGTSDKRLDDKKVRQLSEMGPLSALGYAKKFRKTRTTDEWMHELREGESL